MCVCNDDLTCVFVMLPACERVHLPVRIRACVVSVCVRVGGVGSGSLRSDKVRRNGTLTRSNLGPLVAK